MAHNERVQGGVTTLRTSYKDALESYMDPDSPLETPRRFDTCPFCHEYVRGKGFVVTRTTTGYKMWCHRCHSKRFVKSGVPSASTCLREAKRWLQPQPQCAQEYVAKQIKLPDDFQTEIPTAGQVWLATYGVTNEEIARYNFGYSPGLNRLIMPVYLDGALVFWQGRDLSGDSSRNKYLSVKQSRGSLWFEVNQDNPTTVVVEDVLSALAVARAGYNSVAILGSYVHSEMVGKLATTGTRIVVWLDPDKRKESCAYSKKLRSLGLRSVPVILPDKDPKEYNPNEIKEIVGQAQT